MSLSDEILDITKKVTREWTKQRKAEERGRSRSTREYIYSDRVNCTDVVDSILPAAYAHASGDGQYSVSKRQLYYASREAFKEETGREMDYNYFAQTLLVQYLNRHPEKTATWKITADPRGTLTVPNTGGDRQVRVPVGTLQIDAHLREAAEKCDPYDDAEGDSIPASWPSIAAGQRYRAVLYIEKEGFELLLQEARIAERFDLVILSCKGQSVVAARRFVDQVCAKGSGVPLLVVHDLDKAGFEISQRLTTVSDWAEDTDRVAYQFENEIDVIDLGLRLADVEEYQLPPEHRSFNGGFAPDSIATVKEKEFLCLGKCVELNAFTSPQLVAWLEARLTKHLRGPFIPDDTVLENAYRRALSVASINRAIDEAREEAVTMAQEAAIPKSLRRKLAKAMKASPQAWDLAVYDLARGILEKDEDGE